MAAAQCNKTCTTIPFQGIPNVHDNQLLWLSNAIEGTGYWGWLESQ